MKPKREPRPHIMTTTLVSRNGHRLWYTINTFQLIQSGSSFSFSQALLIFSLKSHSYLCENTWLTCVSEWSRWNPFRRPTNVLCFQICKPSISGSSYPVTSTYREKTFLCPVDCPPAYPIYPGIINGTNEKHVMNYEKGINKKANDVRKKITKRFGWCEEEIVHSNSNWIIEK